MSWLSLCADEISEVLQGTGLRKSEIQRRYGISNKTLKGIYNGQEPKQSGLVERIYNAVKDHTFAIMYEIDADAVQKLATEKNNSEINDYLFSICFHRTKHLTFDKADKLAGMLGVSIWDIATVVKRSDYDH